MKKSILISLHAIFSLICAFYTIFIVFCGFTFTEYVFDWVKKHPGINQIYWEKIDFLFFHIELNFHGEVIYYWCAFVVPLLSMLILCIGSGILLYKYCRMTEAEKTAIRNRKELIKFERRVSRNKRQQVRREKALEKSNKKLLMLQEQLNNAKSDD